MPLRDAFRSLRQELAAVSWRSSARWAARTLTWEVLAALGLATVLLLLASQMPWPDWAIDLGRPDDHFALSGFHDPESGGEMDYRWTQERAAVPLPGVGGGTWVFSLRMQALRPPAGPAAAVEVWVDGRPLAQLAPGSASELGVYSWIGTVPASLGAQAILEVRSTPFSPEGDGRSLGVAVDWIAAHPVAGPAWPVWPTLAACTVLLLSVNVIGRSFGLKRWPALGAMVPAAAGVWLILQEGGRQGLGYLPRLALLALLLAAAALLAGAIRQRVLRSGRTLDWTWAIFLGAIAVRAAVICWPGARIHDLELQEGFLGAFQAGQWGMVWHPYEFGSRDVYYPLVYYALPAGLAALGLRADMALKVAAALLDALAVPLIWALVRRHGAGQGAARWAALLYAAMPINLTVLWWGFFSNIFGQVLVVGTLLYLAHFYGRLQRPAVFLGGVALVALLGASHIGVAITAAAWLGTAWLLLVCTRRGEGRRQALRLGGILLGGALLALLPAAPYLAVLWQSAAAALGAAADSPPFARAPAIASLVARGLLTGYQAWPLLLVPAGAALLARSRSRSVLPLLLLGSAVAALLLFLVNLASGWQVRYLLFLCPLVCICAGLALEWIWRRGGPAGRLAAGLGGALLCAYSLYLWVPGVLWGIKISGAALIH